jgi:hypothetical protein
MSAQEIIEQIKALPFEEQRKLRDLMRSTATSFSPFAEREIVYASDQQARSAGDAVVRQYPETFRRLAQ